MPEPQQIKKAYLQEVEWGKNAQATAKGDQFYVQFNPQSLKVNYSNQKSNNDQKGGAAIQFVGKGTTKLSVELFFDVTGGTANNSTTSDVRDLTKRVAKFIEPRSEGGGNSREEKFIPPGIRFHWGSFEFDGVVDSINETLDYFSNNGTPLRATVALEISRQDIKVEAPKNAPGTKPLHKVSDNEKALQQAVAEQRQQEDWPAIAEANGIENPRMVPPGTLVDLDAGVGGGFSAGVGGGFSAGVGGGFSAGIGATASAGFGASASAGFGAGASAGFGAGASAGFGAGASAGFGAGASAGFGAGASAGFGAGVSGGISAGAAGKLSIGAASQLGFGASSRLNAGASAGIGAGIGGGASAGFGASASAGFGAGASAGFSAGASGGASAGIGSTKIL